MPTLQYWFSGAAFYLAASFAFGIFVGLIGIKNMVSDKAFFFLIVIAVNITLFAWRTAALQEEQNAEFKNTLTRIAKKMNIGEDRVIQPAASSSYCFLKADLTDLKHQTVPLPLWIEATANFHNVQYWISPASAHRNPKDPAYWSLDTPKLLPVVYKSSILSPSRVKPGDYIIEFSTEEGGFVESLKILEFKGELIQVIDVYNGNTSEKLYASPRPEGFIE